MPSRLETLKLGQIEIRGIDGTTPTDFIVGDCPDKKSFLEITNTIDPRVKHLLNVTADRTIIRSVPARSLSYTEYDLKGKQILRRRGASQVTLKGRERVIFHTREEEDIFGTSNISPDMTQREKEICKRLPGVSVQRRSRKEKFGGFVADLVIDIAHLIRLSRPIYISEKAKRKVRQYIPGRRAGLTIRIEARKLRLKRRLGKLIGK